MGADADRPPPWWQRWRRPAAAPPDPRRWVVVDVEASGLDTRHDRLLAIAAVAVHLPPASAIDARPGPAGSAARPTIALGDSFEVVLRQPGQAPDKANILLHGIGVGAQRAGVPADRALAAFAGFVGASPLLAFHAAFDRQMIERARQGLPDVHLASPWLDLAPLAAVLHPAVKAHALDEWLAHFGIVCLQRHQAAADTLATAELLLRLWPALQRQAPGSSFAALQRLTAQQRWLS